MKMKYKSAEEVKEIKSKQAFRKNNERMFKERNSHV